MKKPPLYTVNGALASGVLFYALRLSAPGRGAIDWIVIGLAGCAALWNLAQLGRRLHRAGGGRAVWHEARTVLFWVLGILSAFPAGAPDAGTWRARVGWVLLALALADSVALLRAERLALAASLPLSPPRGE